MWMVEQMRVDWRMEKWMRVDWRTVEEENHRD